MTQALVRDLIVQHDGELRISGLPLRQGERVRVVVMNEGWPAAGSILSTQDTEAELRQRLMGSILEDKDPFGPAAPPEDWEAAP